MSDAERIKNIREQGGGPGDKKRKGPAGTTRSSGGSKASKAASSEKILTFKALFAENTRAVDAGTYFMDAGQ